MACIQLSFSIFNRKCLRDVCNSFAQEDNKFYQLELVNRETNFNKVFNSNPTVGVINPLAKVCSVNTVKQEYSLKFDSILIKYLEKHRLKRLKMFSQI